MTDTTATAAAPFKIVDRSCGRVCFQTNKAWVECYMHENTLWPQRYVVVERSSIRNDDVTSLYFDDFDQAADAYAAAAQRVKVLIERALADTYLD